VLNVKRQTSPVARTWVGCDSSEVYLADTTWEHSRWQPVPAEPVAGEPEPVDVTGISCGFDTIAADTPLPAGIAAGDVIAFLAAGAYEEALAGNFNSMPRPAAVLVSGAEATLVRRRETVDDVLGRDLVPSRLGGGRRALGVDHVAITVADLDRSLAFYTGPLGLRLHDRGDIDPALIERMTGRPGLQVEYADVELGGRVLELLCYRSAAPALPATGGAARPGGVHIGVAVEDAAAVPTRLAAAGFQPQSQPVELPDDGSGWAGAQVFYVRDPDGVTIEIVQRGSGARQRQRELDSGSLARH
jgi:catechol 2,3-dioxygenase-like lactoylglutathione lyase family enzyme